MPKSALLFVFIFCSVIVTGCGAGREYNLSAKSWIGAPVDELITQWGEPDHAPKSVGGYTEYVWSKDTGPHWVKPEVYSPPAQYHDEDDFEHFKRVHDYNNSYDPGGYYSTITCRTTVRVDENKKVVKISPESFMGLTDCRFVNAPAARQQKK